MAAVRKDPGDRTAALAVGRFTCFMKGDWAHGLVLLRSGADAGLAALAGEEIREPADTSAKLALADSWWDIATAQHERLPGGRSGSTPPRGTGRRYR